MSEVVERELPEGWECIKLDDITEEYISGGTPATTNQTYWDGVIPWTRSANISSKYLNCGERFVSETAITETATNIVKNGNVLVATRVGVGKSAVNLIDVAISQDLTGLIVDKSKIFPQYLVNFLHSPAMQCYFNQFSRGTTIKGIQRSDLVRIPIPLPPLETQRKIVAILEKAEATQRLRAEADALSQELVQSVFLEMFGDPVTNPMGWDVKKLGDVSIKIQDGSHFSPKDQNGNIPYITAKNIKPWGIDLSNVTYVNMEFHDKIYSRCDPKQGDVIYIKDGVTAGLAKVNPFNFEFSMLSSIALIRPKESIIDPYFIEYFLNHPNVKQRILERKSGAAITRLILKEIKNIKIIVPPYEMQKWFGDFVKSSELNRLEQKKSEEIINHFGNSVLSKAFTGDLIT